MSVQIKLSPLAQLPDAEPHDDFSTELTAGNVYDSLCEQIAAIRTKALMGHDKNKLRQDYLDACKERDKFLSVLQEFPLQTLQHDFDVTLTLLQAKEPTHEANPINTRKRAVRRF